MSSSRTVLKRVVGDHFEPDDAMDPKTQRALRGQLEQIDYTAYAANKKVGAALGAFETQKFERLGLVTAMARARWVAAGVALGDAGQIPSPAKVAELAQLRAAYEELSEVYDAARRMVERGYVGYGGVGI
jgi:hypothetical protein